MFNTHVFNQCKNSEDVLMSIDNWRQVHPLLKTIPVDWSYTIPYGLLHSPNPSHTVSRFLQAVSTLLEL